MSRALLVTLFVLAMPLSAQDRVPTAADSARARLASARSDLRNLVVAQEAFFADNARYAKSLAELAQGYKPSEGSRVRLVFAQDNAWSGDVMRDGLVGSCTIWVGISPENRAKTALNGLVGEEGVPTCDPQPALTPAVLPPATARPPRR